MSIKFVVERHPTCYIAYPLGIQGIVVGQSNTYQDALEDAKSALRFHIETFGEEVLENESSIIEASIREEIFAWQLNFLPKLLRKEFLKTLKNLGFEIVREKEHISMMRIDLTGKKTPLTMPNHPKINGDLLRLICTQAGISREEFIKMYNKS